MTAAANTEPLNGEPDKPRGKMKYFRGKRSDELLAAIFEDMAQYNMTEAQACAGHGVRAETFSRWKNDPNCEGLRARAQFYQIKRLCHKQETEPEDWKRWQWRLQVTYRQQFGDPTKVAFQLNQQFNNGDGDLAPNQAELEEARKRLDQAKLRQAKWKAGVASDIELRERMVAEIAERQRVVDYIDGGGTLDQEEQKQLRQRLEDENSNRRQEPIRTAIGHVVGEEQGSLAIEDESRPEPAPGPKRPQPGPPATSMRASDMDPLSGVAKPAEPPIPWRDRKPPIGPPSERQRENQQRRLEWERARRGGDGKSPFSGGQD